MIVYKGGENMEDKLYSIIERYNIDIDKAEKEFTEKMETDAEFRMIIEEIMRRYEQQSSHKKTNKTTEK